MITVTAFHIWCLMILGSSCSNEDLLEENVGNSMDPSTDHDGDGYPFSEDCDDVDASVNPGVPFTCVWSKLPVCERVHEDLFSASAMEPPSANSNAYVVPEAVLRENLALSIQAALDGNADESIHHATLADYNVCAEGSLLLWSPPAGSGSAHLALRTHPDAIDLIIQTPHSFYDLGTREEGLFLFQQSDARALLSSGTHRCASDRSSNCSGETKVCTVFSSEPFRISDMAHTDTSFFHTAHIALADGLPSTTILQLHMFLDPGASVSNGKKRNTTADQPSARFAEALTEAFPNEFITSCNDYGAGNEADRTCGTSNTQGRHLNGSDDACGESPSEVSGRFIHLEQNVSVINQADKVAEAIENTF